MMDGWFRESQGKSQKRQQWAIGGSSSNLVATSSNTGAITAAGVLTFRLGVFLGPRRGVEQVKEYGACNQIKSNQ
jgi:hypothetical protein